MRLPVDDDESAFEKKCESNKYNKIFIDEKGGVLPFCQPMCPLNYRRLNRRVQYVLLS